MKINQQIKINNEALVALINETDWLTHDNKAIRFITVMVRNLHLSNFAKTSPKN